MSGLASSFVSSRSFTAAASVRLTTVGWGSIMRCVLLRTGCGAGGDKCCRHRTHRNRFVQARRRYRELQADHGAAVGVSAACEGRERRDGVATKILEGFRCCGKRGAIAPGVRNEQDDRGDATVPPLQGELAFEGLNVIDPCFGLDGYAPSSALDHAVPRPAIARDRERDLAPEPKAGVETPRQAIEEPVLGSVADRVAGGVRPQWEVEADDGGDSHEATVRDVRGAPPLDPSDLDMGGISRGTDCPEAEPTPDSRAAQLAAQRVERLVGDSRRTVRGSFSR